MAASWRAGNPNTLETSRSSWSLSCCLSSRSACRHCPSGAVRGYGPRFGNDGYPSAAGFLSRVPSSKLMSPGGVAPLASGIAADSDRPPSGDLRCVALLAGSIQEVRRLVNPISGQSYYAMTIATDRGLVNLACNVDAVAGPVPTLGAVAQARARLIARLVNFHPRRHRLLWAAARLARRRNRSRHVAGVTARAGWQQPGSDPQPE